MSAERDKKWGDKNPKKGNLGKKELRNQKLSARRSEHQFFNFEIRLLIGGTIPRRKGRDERKTCEGEDKLTSGKQRAV